MKKVKANRFFSVIVLSFLLTGFVCAQSEQSPGFSQLRDKTANFSNGKSEKSKSFEMLSFWTKDNKRDEIFYYTYKSPVRTEIPLSYVGKTSDRKGFILRSSKGLVMRIYPIGKRLKVYNQRTKKTTWFVWEYVGPVDGVGTWCDSCIQEALRAVQFVRKYFVSN